MITRAAMGPITAPAIQALLEEPLLLGLADCVPLCEPARACVELAAELDDPELLRVVLEDEEVV